MRCKRPRVIPPDASVGTRPATCFTAAASSRSPRLSSRSKSAPAARASSICSGVLTSASTRRNGEAAALARRTASPIPPAAAAWLSLTRMPSKSAPRWFVPPPANAEDAGAGIGGLALTEQGLQLAVRVERAEDARGGGDAGDDQRFLRDHQGGAARLRRNAGLGRPVAGAHVLFQ